MPTHQIVKISELDSDKEYMDAGYKTGRKKHIRHPKIC
jgi:hypothetical protein